MKKTILLIFFMLLLPRIILGQYNLQNKEELNSFNSIPKEQVFIHYNSRLLLTGEYLYYKLYCRNSESTAPSEISKIGYVELIRKDGVSVFRHKISLTNGLGQGDFFVPVDINTGHYKLVGYTQWMRNEGEQSFFADNIVIINPYKELPKGTSLNSMDTLKLIPKDIAKNPIEALASIKKNSPIHIELPKRTFGKRKLVKLQVKKSVQDSLKGNYSISVRKNEIADFLPRQNSETFTTNLHPPQEINQIEAKNKYSQVDDASKIISGRIISTIDSLPIPNESIGLFTSEDSNTAKLFYSDTNGAFRFNVNESDEIILKLIGGKNGEAKIVLDSNISPLNIKPKQVDPTKDYDKIYLPELRGELISGHIISKTDNEPIENQNISLSIAGRNGLTKISRTNENGAFYFNLDVNNRNKEVILSILDKNQEDAEIILTPDAAVNLTSFDFKEVDISPDLNPIFEQRSIYNQIENAFFEQKADSTIPSINIIPAHKNFQEIYTLDDYTRFRNLRETIVEIIEHVLVKKKKDQLIIQIRGNDEFFIDSDAMPLLLVDNVLVQNTTNLFDYDVKKIKRIGISRSDYYIGPKKYQGIFAIETNDGDYASPINTNSSSIQTIPGPIPTKKYYIQNYSQTHSERTKHIADFRQQLLWLPNVLIDKTAIFEFYTSDNIGTYEISIEGFTENGAPVSISESIYVE